MSSRSRSLLVAFLIGWIILSQPVIILAQQNSVEAQAKADAERDATTDVNRLLWVGVGGVYICSIVCCALGDAFATGLSGGSGTSSPTGIDFDPTSIAISPRPERLIGKSPEYIDVYTDAYKKKVKQLREDSAAIGGIGVACLMGCMVLLMVLDD